MYTQCRSRPPARPRARVSTPRALCPGSTWKHRRKVKVRNGDRGEITREQVGGRGLTDEPGSGPAPRGGPVMTGSPGRDVSEASGPGRPSARVISARGAGTKEKTALVTHRTPGGPRALVRVGRAGQSRAESRLPGLCPRPPPGTEPVVRLLTTAAAGAGPAREGERRLGQ